jgi:hypothetical protein
VSTADLAAIFGRLQRPDDDTADTPAFAAAPIQGSAHRLARDSRGQPALLLAVDEAETVPRPPIVLQHIAVRHGIGCRIRHEAGGLEHGKFSIVQCLGGDPALHLHFLRAAGSVVLAMGDSPSSQQLSGAIATLVRLFRATTAEPRKKIQGLWAELLIIARSKEPRSLIGAWHSTPEDLYDFADGAARIEVKSSFDRARLHYFRMEQLHPAALCEVVVASVVVQPSSGGESVHDLLIEIRDGANPDPEQLVKLEAVVAMALGSDWPAAMSTRFDRQLAQASIAFFDARAVPSPSPDLPRGVSDVRFRASLDGLSPLRIDINATQLFRAAVPRGR